MDLLSRLLDLTPITGHLDVRCHFGAPWRLEKPVADALEIQYHVLLSGSAVLDDELGTATMQAGDIVLFPAGGAHALHDGGGRRPRALTAQMSQVITIAQNAGKGPASDLLCGRFVLPASSERLIRGFLPQRMIVSSMPMNEGVSVDAQPGRLARLISLMREEAAEEGPGSASLIGHLSAALFSLSLRAAMHAGAAAELPPSLLALSSRPRLLPAVTAMFDAPCRAWTLPQLADLCHMSRATFVRQFQDAAGHSPVQLLDEIRMAQALRHLGGTDHSVAMIGEAAGYQSEAAFQRAFKRHTGVTPARWRAARRS